MWYEDTKTIGIKLSQDNSGLLATLVIPCGEASNSSDQSSLRGFLFFKSPHSDGAWFGLLKNKKPAADAAGLI